MEKEFTIKYYLKAVVSYETTVEAGSEAEAEKMFKSGSYGQVEDEIDWETNELVILKITEEEG